jgi:hypothetical protein
LDEVLDAANRDKAKILLIFAGRKSLKPTKLAEKTPSSGKINPSWNFSLFYC